jgi:hypothetical protein
MNIILPFYESTYPTCKCFLINYREYPCDHYTSVINVSLLMTGCPRVEVHSTALQLLQLLDKRFFGTVGPLHNESDKGELIFLCVLKMLRFRFLYQFYGHCGTHPKVMPVLGWKLRRQKFGKTTTIYRLVQTTAFFRIVLLIL